MISDRTRNTIVGLTILAALAVGIVGIFKLNLAPDYFRPKPYEVLINTANAAGIQPGARVSLNGATVGSVKSVQLVTNAAAPTTMPASGLAAALSTEPTPLPSVYAKVVMLIDPSYRLPKGTTASIGAPGFSFSGAAVSLTAPALATTEFLPTDGSASITAVPGDSGLLPKEVFADINTLKEDLSVLSKELTTVARDLHTMFAYTPLEKMNEYKIGDPRRPPDNISTLVLRLNIAVDNINKLLEDPSLPNNFHTLVANLVDASNQLKDVLATIKTTMASADTNLAKFGAASDNISAAAKSAGTTFDVAQTRLTQVSEKLVVTLRTLDESLNAISKGDGTTGKLIRDPKLYDSLVDLTRSLNATTDEINKLVHQWKQDGVPLRVGPK